LSRSYYFRQFVFGLIFPALIIYAFKKHDDALPFLTILVLVINTVLYPYARFVYESIVSFIIGDNVFIINAFMMLIAKLMTMAICWGIDLPPNGSTIR
jgi:hypothetical protein